LHCQSWLSFEPCPVWVRLSCDASNGWEEDRSISRADGLMASNGLLISDLVTTVTKKELAKAPAP